MPDATSGQWDVTVPSIHLNMTSGNTVVKPADFNTPITAQTDWKEPSKNSNPHTPGTEFKERQLVSQKRRRERHSKKNLNKSSSSKANEPRCQDRYSESYRSQILR
ncbi:hypothetical protein B0H19DRAFT_1081538 [Mycena capillaripes]|nr:hypothetical protein B0H19DRAFT_1081538 [Mycena capillaripes]